MYPIKGGMNGGTKVIVFVEGLRSDNAASISCTFGTIRVTAIDMNKDSFTCVAPSLRFPFTANSEYIVSFAASIQDMEIIRNRTFTYTHSPMVSSTYYEDRIAAPWLLVRVTCYRTGRCASPSTMSVTRCHVSYGHESDAQIKLATSACEA